MTTTQNTDKQTRDRSNGRYSYDNRWDRVCRRCGLILGVHTAEAPHIVDDIHDGRQVSCPGFKPERKR